MTQNELGALIFAGIILGAFFLIAIIYIAIGTYRQKKTERAYRKYKDLAKAKREYEELDARYEEIASKHRSIKKRIDVMLENEKYLTKVKVFNQQKELEKLREKIKSSLCTPTVVYPTTLSFSLFSFNKQSKSPSKV